MEESLKKVLKEKLRAILQSFGVDPGTVDLDKAIDDGSVKLPDGHVLQVSVVDERDSKTISKDWGEYMRALNTVGSGIDKLLEAMTADYEEALLVTDKQEREDIAHASMHRIVIALEILLKLCRLNMPCSVEEKVNAPSCNTVQ